MTYGSVSVDSVVTSSGQTLGAGNATSFKNRIINGAMTIDQRNAGASVTPSADTYLVDRWQYSASQASKFTWQQNKGSVTPPAGFVNYLGGSVAAAVTVGAADYFALVQKIEGLNIADLGWGTANAQTITLSFQVYSSLTGTFGGTLTNSANNRTYPFTYSIPESNTWTTISLAIAGDTSGTWLTTTGVGIGVQFGLGVGSTYSGTAGAWSGTQYISATGATSVVGTSGATFYITGVQLEVGSAATSFDFRSIGQELALCQRYFEKSAPQSTAITVNNAGGLYPVPFLTVPNGAYYATVKFSVAKRVSPTVTTYPYGTAANTTRWSSDVGADFAANSAFIGGGQESMFSVVNNSGSSFTTGTQYAVIGSWYASAEL